MNALRMALAGTVATLAVAIPGAVGGTTSAYGEPIGDVWTCTTTDAALQQKFDELYQFGLMPLGVDGAFVVPDPVHDGQTFDVDVDFAATVPDEIRDWLAGEGFTSVTAVEGAWELKGGQRITGIDSVPWDGEAKPLDANVSLAFDMVGVLDDAFTAHLNDGDAVPALATLLLTEKTDVTLEATDGNQTTTFELSCSTPDNHGVAVATTHVLAAPVEPQDPGSEPGPAAPVPADPSFTG